MTEEGEKEMSGKSDCERCDESSTLEQLAQYWCILVPRKGGGLCVCVCVCVCVKTRPKHRVHPPTLYTHAKLSLPLCNSSFKVQSLRFKVHVSMTNTFHSSSTFRIVSNGWQKTHPLLKCQ